MPTANKKQNNKQTNMLKSKLSECNREWVRKSTLIIAWHLMRLPWGVDVRGKSYFCYSRRALASCSLSHFIISWGYWYVTHCFSHRDLKGILNLKFFTPVTQTQTDLSGSLNWLPHKLNTFITGFVLLSVAFFPVRESKLF